MHSPHRGANNQARTSLKSRLVMKTHTCDYKEFVTSSVKKYRNTWPCVWRQGDVSVFLHIHIQLYTNILLTSVYSLDVKADSSAVSVVLNIPGYQEVVINCLLHSLNTPIPHRTHCQDYRESGVRFVRATKCPGCIEIQVICQCCHSHRCRSPPHTI